MKSKVSRGSAANYATGDALMTQMVKAGLQSSLHDSGSAAAKQRALVTVFQFANSRMLADTLRWPAGEGSTSRNLLMALTTVIVQECGMSRMMDALALEAFNRSCSDDRTEIEQNAWRRVGDAILVARSVARANDV